MALFELAALNGAGEKIGDGGEEHRLLRGKAPLLAAANAENAVSAAVAAGDGDVHAAGAIVVLQIGRDREPLLAGKILDHGWHGGFQREAGEAAGLRHRHHRADEIALPAEAGAQQQLAVAGQKFEDFDEIDRQRERHGRDRVVEQPLDIGLGQRPLAELGERFLLLGAATQLVLETDPPRHIVAETRHALGFAAFGNDRSRGFEPALVATFELRRTIARAERRLRMHRLLEQGFDISAVFAVNAAEETR